AFAPERHEHDEERHAPPERPGREARVDVIVDPGQDEEEREPQGHAGDVPLEEEVLRLEPLRAEERARRVDHHDAERGERGHGEKERAVDPRDRELAHRRPRSIERFSSITAASKRAPRSSKFRNMSKLAQPGERRTTPPGVAWDRASPTASSRVFARVPGTWLKARSSLDVASPT